MGYHVAKIEKGFLGAISKIQEELDELKDAHQQGARILALCEMADLLGAMQAYLEFQFPGMTMDDLLTMSRLTRRAFESGAR